MKFIDIPTEQTTAVTDAVLATIALVSVIYLLRFSKKNPWKIRLWVCLFSLLALASILGTIVHGIKISSMLQTLLWHPLYLLLGLLVGIYVVAVVNDIWGQSASRRILPKMLIAGAGFWCITLIWRDSFLVFTVYEAAGMFFALGGYLWLTYRGHFKGAMVMAAGTLVTIFAAGIPAIDSFSFTCIWSFDHNGIYHMAQMFGIVLLVTGLRKSLPSHSDNTPDFNV